MWESFIVLFVMQPWEVDDYIEVQNYPGMTVDSMTLYSTYGYTSTGVWLSIPNAPALQTRFEKLLQLQRVYKIITAFVPAS
jgi:small-conductance mechanosensitive channel